MKKDVFDHKQCYGAMFFTKTHLYAGGAIHVLATGFMLFDSENMNENNAQQISVANILWKEGNTFKFCWSLTTQ